MINFTGDEQEYTKGNTRTQPSQPAVGGYDGIDFASESDKSGDQYRTIRGKPFQSGNKPTLGKDVFESPTDY